MKYILPGMILFLLTIIGVERTEATPLGLPARDYSVELNMAGTTFDATGTMTIGPTTVTSFHVDSNATLGLFDCDPCTLSLDTPDHVGFNDDINGFAITDATTGNFLHLNPDGSGIFFTIVPIQASGNISWLAATVPEPTSSILLLLGISALALRARMRQGK
jgi:hypothetical protein